MQENNKFKIHKDSEIWNYDGKVKFIRELVDFFEEERKKVVRDDKSDGRHIAFEDLDDDSTYNLIVKKDLGVPEKVEINFIFEEVYKVLANATKLERERFFLNKINGLKIIEIAKLENVSEFAVRKSVKAVSNKIANIIESYK